LIHIDENGDAGGNYTIVGMKSIDNGEMNKSSYGLFPIGTFTTRTNASNSIPVRKRFNFICALISYSSFHKYVNSHERKLLFILWQIIKKTLLKKRVENCYIHCRIQFVFKLNLFSWEMSSLKNESEQRKFEVSGIFFLLKSA
jgi:hypothetical protein